MNLCPVSLLPHPYPPPSPPHLPHPAVSLPPILTPTPTFPILHPHLLPSALSVSSTPPILHCPTDSPCAFCLIIDIDCCRMLIVRSRRNPTPRLQLTCFPLRRPWGAVPPCKRASLAIWRWHPTARRQQPRPGRCPGACSYLQDPCFCHLKACARSGTPFVAGCGSVREP